MASYNRIILVGNLTRDPELSYTPANTAVCKFGIATNRKWRDRDGNEREDVCFVDCALFGKGGEVLHKYMAKGRSILVEGRLTLNRWTGQDGQKHSKHEVFVENFTFLGSGQRPEGGEGPGRGSDRGEDRGASRGSDRGDARGGGGGAGYSSGGGGGGGGYSSGDDGPPAYDDTTVPAGEDIPF
jgi:single-strand DNA-binding protein